MVSVGRWRVGFPCWVGVAVLALVALPGASAQEPPSLGPVFVGTELDDYLRLLELRGRLQGGPLVFRPLSARWATTALGADSAGHPWAGRYPLPGAGAQVGLRPRLRWLQTVAHGAYRSAYPRSVNDGALWAGRGLSAEWRGGAQVLWGPVTATWYPTIWFAQNADFPTVQVSNPARSPFSYPWRADIDWPQRFGPGAVAAFDWGQSGLRLDLGAFTAGVSTENLWWGPAVRYPILMSNTAAGFPHLDLGTGRPVRTPIGRLEVRGVWGMLTKSAYFDTARTGGRRLFVALTAGWEPRWVPGLTVGLGRVFYMPWDSVRAQDLDVFLQTVFKRSFSTPQNPGGDDYRDQLLSLYARWRLPESAVEFYAEWARNDHSWDLRDFILEPEHSQGYVLGLAKVFGEPAQLWHFRAELADLERSRTFQVRASPVFYVHHIAVQGYTQRGQLLGAGFGPSGSSQFVGLDRYSPKGRLGAYLERVRYDNDAYYERFGATERREGHDVELSAGLSAVRFWGPFDLRAAVAVSRELNRYFQVGNDHTNLQADLTLAWRPERRRS